MASCPRSVFPGFTFGNLTVVSRNGSRPNKAALWLWRCQCGAEFTATYLDIRRGRRYTCTCGSDRDETHSIHVLTKQTEARVQAMFYKVHNLQVEVQAMTKTMQAVMGLLVELLSHPESHADAEKIVRDFVFRKGQ